MSYFNTKKVALNGILAAITVICLFLATVLPTSKLSFYALSSFVISIIMVEYGTRAGIIFYILTNILAFLVIPDKIKIIPYSVFFGIYGIIKFHIERINRIIAEYILKFVYFNICIVIWLMLFKEIFLPSGAEAELKFSLWVVIVVLELVFMLYDCVYTLFIQYYIKKIRRFLKI